MFHDVLIERYIFNQWSYSCRFQCSGNSDRLTILVRIGAKGSMSCLIIGVGIRFKPHDFAFDFCTIFLISS